MRFKTLKRHIIKLHCILQTGTFMISMLEKLIPHLFRLAMKLGFISVNM